MTAPPATVPQVGAPLSRDTVNAQVGAAAQSFKRGLDELVTAFEWQEAYSAEQLEALGFTADEAALLKSALGEVPGIDDAVDATSFLKRLWSTGI